MAGNIDNERGISLQLSENLCKNFPFLEWSSRNKSWICAPKKKDCGYPNKTPIIESTDGNEILSMSNLPSDSCFNCPIKPSNREGKDYLKVILKVFSPGDYQRECATKMWSQGTGTKD